MDMPRDFIGYANSPPKLEWPNGARLALSIVVNYEEGSERNPLDGDTVIDVQREQAVQPTPPGARDIVSESVYEYGSRVGIWRLIDVLAEYEVPATIYVCAVALERNPFVARAFVEREYDMVGHGYRWMPPYGLTEDQEREQIQKAVESVQRTTGQRMLGWFSRGQTLATRRILAEEGFLFDCHGTNDDIPYFHDVLGRPMLVVPYTIDNNDYRFWNGSFFTARDFEIYCTDAFDALYRESARTPRMMTVGLHPRVIGRPGRILGLERFLAHARAHPDVWVATRTEIARFWAERFAPPNTWNWPV